MTRQPTAVNFAVLLVSFLAVPVWAEDKRTSELAKPTAAPTVQQVRQAVERSLPYLEKDGLAWMKERKCIACHHAAFLLWSHNEARLRGFAVDPKKLDDWTTQALTMHLAGRKDFEAKKSGYVESTNLLLGQVVPTAAQGKTADELKVLAALIANGQQPAGLWKYAGQLQKRPDQEADATTTLWAVLALTSAEPMNPSAAKQGVPALAWLKKDQTGEGNEAAVLRLLIERQFGDTGRAQALLKNLVSRQNPDGGWSWSKGLPSDVLATGQSLYALARAGVKSDDPCVQRAWKFLVEKQRPDGSWYAPTKKPGGKDNVVAPYWATAWATIGLVRTLPAEAAAGAKPMAARMVYYSGRVQGVGFRAATAEMARAYPVTGWVKNLADGRVQLLAEGPEEGVQGFLKAVRSRWQGNIEKEQAETPAVSGKFTKFEVVQ